MLTPRDISESSFPRSVFGGYDQESVDEFLETVLRDYTELTKINKELNAKIDKMKVTLTDYQKAERRMRNSAVDAKRKGRLLYPIIGSQMPAEAADAVTASIEAEAASRDRLDSVRSQLSDAITQLDTTNAQLESAEAQLGNVREEIALVNESLDDLTLQIELEKKKLHSSRAETAKFAGSAQKLMEDFILDSGRLTSDFIARSDKLTEDFLRCTSGLATEFRENTKKLTLDLTAGTDALSDGYEKSLTDIMTNSDAFDSGEDPVFDTAADDETAEEAYIPDETDVLIDEITAAINGVETAPEEPVSPPKSPGAGKKKKKKK